MLNVFTLANGRLFQEEIESLEELAQFKPIWVDLEDPTPEERRWVKQHFGLSIPEDAMDDDIEESARFFEEDNGELHIRSDFLIDDDVTPRNVRVAFILKDGVLFSVHGEDLPVFRLLRLRARGRSLRIIQNSRTACGLSKGNPRESGCVHITRVEKDVDIRTKWEQS